MKRTTATELLAATESRFKAAEEKLRKDKAERLKQLRARQNREERCAVEKLVQGARSRDIRRKILAGALLLKIMDVDPRCKEEFTAHLDAFLVRDHDRAAFDLAPTGDLFD